MSNRKNESLRIIREKGVKVMDQINEVINSVDLNDKDSVWYDYLEKDCSTWEQYTERLDVQTKLIEKNVETLIQIVKIIMEAERDEPEVFNFLIRPDSEFMPEKLYQTTKTVAEAMERENRNITSSEVILIWNQYSITKEG